VKGAGLVAEAAELAEVGAGGLGVERPGWDGHEADGLEGLERLQGGEQSGKLFGGEAVLGVFVAELDLDEDAELFAEGSSGGVEALGDLEGVDGVDGVEELGGAGGLVGLEGADEVEVGVGERGEMLGFLLKLLDAVFAEETLAGGVGFEDDVEGMDFADGHEGDVGFGAVGAMTGGGDLFSKAGYIFSDGHAVWILSSSRLRYGEDGGREGQATKAILSDRFCLLIEGSPD